MIAVPVRGFEGSKSRLASILTEPMRNRLTMALATKTVTTAIESGHRTAVVTADPVVGAWATHLGAETIDEPGTSGLDGAAAAVMRWASVRGHAWMTVHADLPLLTSDDLRHAAGARPDRGYVIAPSYNGGTPLLGGTEAVATAYGEGSFHRHLATIGPAAHAVVLTPGLAVDIDSAQDYETVRRLPDGAWLASIV